VRTPRPKPNKLHDELDALLDGRPVELTDELAPLAEAADALRAELATLQLDPEVADRHLERALERSGTVLELPVRRQPSGWDVRRRVVAVALAAALVLAPATMASAAALPGQAMYPLKRAIEEIRVASVQWSPSREAAERTRIADTRLGEVKDLYRLEMFTQLPTALRALEQAVVAARIAVTEAVREGEAVPTVAAHLDEVVVDGRQVVARVAVAASNESVVLPRGTREAIQAAVRQSQDVLPPPAQTPTQGTSTPTTSPSPPDPGSDPTSGPTSPPPSATQPPEPPTTAPPTTAPPTTAPPTTAPPTTAPPTTEAPANPGSGDVGGEGGQPGSPDKAPYEGGNTPSTTLPTP
jgi:Domain of unknown function (DUF5667)